MNLTAYSDGGCRKSTNVAAYAAVITDEVGDKVTISEATEYMTNNVAEYLGLMAALQYTVESKAHSLQMHMDSELVVRQMTGVYSVSDPKMRVLWTEAQKLVKLIPLFSIRHVYREFNKEADELVNVAMEAKLRGASGSKLTVLHKTTRQAN